MRGACIVWTGVVAASAALAGGCSRCDAEGVEEAATLMQDRSIPARKAAFAALGQACPGIPTGLGESLAASYGGLSPDAASTVYAGRGKDRGYARALRAACPVDEDTWRDAVTSEERSAAVYATCDLQRFGLYEAGESFAMDDMDAVVLYSWLEGARADQATARRLVRGLLASVGTPSDVMHRCLARGTACEAALKRYAMRPVLTSSDAPLPAAEVFVTLSPDAIVVNGETLTKLDAGKLTEGSIERGQITSLRTFLDGRRAQRRELLDTPGMTPEDETMAIVVAAGSDTPAGLVLDVLFTAARAGWTEMALMGISGDEGAAIRVTPPIAWLAGERPAMRRASEPMIVQVDPTGITVDGVGEPTRLTATECDDHDVCFDQPAVATALAEAHRQYDDQTVFTLQVADGVPVASMAAVIDLARGTDCKLASVYDALPAECQFIHAVVDGKPPRNWRTGVAHTLSLGAATAKTYHEDRPTNRHQARVLAQYEQVRESLRACLLADEAFVAHAEPRPFSILYGTDRGSKTEMRVLLGDMAGPEYEPWSSPKLNACMASALGVSPADAEVGGTRFLTEQARFEVRVPIQLDDSVGADTDDPDAD